MRTAAPNPNLFLLAAVPPLLSVYVPHAVSHPLLRHSAGLLYSLVFLPVVECITGYPDLLRLVRSGCESRPVTTWANTEVIVSSISSLQVHRSQSQSTKRDTITTPKPVNLHDRPVFRIALLLSLLSVTFTLFHAILCVSSSTSPSSTFIPIVLARAAPRTFAQFLLSLLSLGYVVVTGYVCAHELMHKTGPRFQLERLIAMLYLSIMLNPAYFVDHHHHHVHVGTDKDTASARRGDTSYGYFVRQQYGAWSRALRTSLHLLRGSFGVIHFLQRDRFARALLGTIISVGAAYSVFGGTAFAYYVAMAGMGMFLMDCANYVQHYGLRRSRDPVTGKLEPVDRMHSWDCSYTLPNLVTFNIGHHAHHHIDGTMAYPALEAGVGPEFPLGMHCMTWLTLFPPLFWRIADPMVDEIERQKAARMKT